MGRILGGTFARVFGRTSCAGRHTKPAPLVISCERPSESEISPVGGEGRECWEEVRYLRWAPLKTMRKNSRNRGVVARRVAAAAMLLMLLVAFPSSMLAKR